MRRKNLPRYHSFCVNDTTLGDNPLGDVPHALTRRDGADYTRGKGNCSRDFTVPAQKGYAMPSAAQLHRPCALCEFSTFCFFIIAFQHILSYFISIVKGFGLEKHWDI